jgi:hypothetical protein
LFIIFSVKNLRSFSVKKFVSLSRSHHEVYSANMPCGDANVESKLRHIIETGTPKTLTYKGNKKYISKAKINEIRDQQKSGGILPLLALLPLIFGGVAATGAIAGGAASIAKTVQDGKANDAKLAQQKVHDKKMETILSKGGANGVTGDGIFLPEYQKGNGFSEGIKSFVDKTGLDEMGKKLLRKTLKPLSHKLNMFVQGDGLYITPK